MLKLNALAMLHLKNKGDNELKLMINFPLKLFDFFSQSFPCIYFQGGKAHQGRERAAGAAAAHSSQVAISKQRSLERTDLWSEIVDAEDMPFCSVCPANFLVCATCYLQLEPNIQQEQRGVCCRFTWKDAQAFLDFSMMQVEMQ